MTGIAWVTGAGGLIGSYLCKTAPRAFQAVPIHSDLLAPSEHEELRSRFERDEVGAIIHCAAISKTPACEENPALAREVNTNLTKRLSELAKDIPFIFLSSDLVFDGQKGNYSENDAPNPLSVYGETKVRAETFVLTNPGHIVIRTSLNAGRSPKGRAFNEEINKAFAAGKTLNLFVDEFRCPIAAEVTARAIWDLVGVAPGGIYHLCGAERLSRFQIGELLAANHPELNPKIERGTLRDYEGAPRAPDTSMNCAKIQDELSFQLPKFSDWVRAQPAGSL